MLHVLALRAKVKGEMRKQFELYHSKLISQPIRAFVLQTLRSYKDYQREKKKRFLGFGKSM